MNHKETKKGALRGIVGEERKNLGRSAEELIVDNKNTIVYFNKSLSILSIGLNNLIFRLLSFSFFNIATSNVIDRYHIVIRYTM